MSIDGIKHIMQEMHERERIYHGRRLFSVDKLTVRGRKKGDHQHHRTHRTGRKRVGIQQIASENFLSTTTIVKMCKRLGFDGYSELYYYLSRQFDSHDEGRGAENLKSLIDNYPMS